jgi:hypothetical protein
MTPRDQLAWCAKFRTAYAIASLSLFASVPSTTPAQPLLDTTSVMLSTARLAQLGPLPSEKWFFTRIAEIAVDSRGQVFVLDDLECKIHVFNAAGTRIRTLGRKGAGPGEFDRPRRLQVLGDTVFIVDRVNHRIVSYSAITGAVVKNRRGFPSTGTAGGLSPTGEYQVRPGSPDAVGTRGPVPFTIEHVDAVSKVLNTVARLVRNHGTLIYMAYRDRLPALTTTRGGTSNRPQPFDDTALFDLTADGRSLVVVERAASAFTGSRNPFASTRAQGLLRIRHTALTGSTVSERTFKTIARPLTAKDVQTVVDSFARATIAPGVVFVARPSDIRDSLFVPDTWPTVMALFVGIDGTLWLRQPQSSSSFAHFWRIDAQGNQLPPVAVPSRLLILRVTGDKVWAAGEDADGNPVVEVYRVVRK